MFPGLKAIIQKPVAIDAQFRHYLLTAIGKVSGFGLQFYPSVFAHVKKSFKNLFKNY